MLLLLVTLILAAIPRAPGALADIPVPGGSEEEAMGEAHLPSPRDSLAVGADSLPPPEPADSLDVTEEPFMWLGDDSLVALPCGIPAPRQLFPGNIRVMTEPDIDRTGAKTLGELLAWLGDSQILDGGFMLDEQYLSLRGSLPHEVAVMVDGVRANEPASGLADLRDVPVEAVSRIEILEGPMASLVAPEATEAVVSIVTCRHPGGAPASRIAIMDGGGGFTMIEGSYSEKVLETGYLNLTASRISLDGLSEDVPSTDLAVWARAGCELKGVDLEGWVRRTAVDREEEGGDSLGTHEAFTVGFGATRALRKNLFVSGFFSRTSHEFGGRFDFPVGEGSESGRTTFDVSLLADRGRGRSAKIGFEWERSRYEPQDGQWWRLMRSSLYGLASLGPTEYLSMQAGARVDSYKDEKTVATAAFSLGLAGHTRARPYISLSLGDFLSRTSYETFITGSSGAVELGSDFSLLEFLDAQVSFMVRDFGDHAVPMGQGSSADFDTLPEFPDYDSYRRAFEGSLDYRPSGSFSLGFAFTRASFGDISLGVSEEIDVQPKTILSFTSSLRKNLKGENLVFEGAVLAKRVHEEELTLLDMTAGIRIVDVLLFYTGSNILDERDETYPGFAPHGRYGKWGFSWKFLD